MRCGAQTERRTKAPHVNMGKLRSVAFSSARADFAGNLRYPLTPFQPRARSHPGVPGWRRETAKSTTGQKLGSHS